MALERVYSPGVPVLRPSHFTTTWWLLTRGPHKLTPAQFNTVHQGIDQLMIGTHVDVTVPGWKAGTVWTNLPWQVLYDVPAQYDERLAALMLGLMAQYAFIHHPSQWYTGTTTYNGRTVPNCYYFQARGLDEWKRRNDIHIWEDERE
jgi:hypothetical protein